MTRTRIRTAGVAAGIGVPFAGLLWLAFGFGPESAGPEGLWRVAAGILVAVLALLVLRARDPLPPIRGASIRPRVPRIDRWMVTQAIGFATQVVGSAGVAYLLFGVFVASRLPSGPPSYYYDAPERTYPDLPVWTAVLAVALVGLTLCSIRWSAAMFGSIVLATIALAFGMTSNLKKPPELLGLSFGQLIAIAALSVIGGAMFRIVSATLARRASPPPTDW